jgi:hypothetical protein
MKIETAKELRQRYDRETKEGFARLEAIYRPLDVWEQALVKSLARTEWRLKNTEAMMADCQTRNMPEHHRQSLLEELAKVYAFRQRSWSRTCKQLRAAQRARVRAGKRIQLHKQVEYLYLQ